MKKVYINEYGPRVSAAVYGFWRWTEEDLQDTKNFEDVVLFTRELGIDTYDLSPGHGAYELETQFGKLIESGVINQSELVLSKKVGLREYSGAYGSGIYYDLSPQYITTSVEESLKRLKRDKIEILILENFDFLSDFEQTASALLKLQRSGKISYIGVSNFNVFQQRLLSASLSQPIITNHLELNLLQTEALHDGRYDFIREQHGRAMAFSPLADGRILLGEDAQAVKLRLALIEIGKKYEANVEQIAVAWLNKLGALPIIGSKEKRRIQNAATAHTFELSQEDWYFLYNATK
ncbi:aldo/keto reductase [Fluviicola sp.]|uniref:aldo/keto reductase n=1 Tax=Fluviicola sp. TaxID=1917219 RepID=UPI00261AF92D|nr:aldo/keto reductase [Fluviicola sp.]